MNCLFIKGLGALRAFFLFLAFFVTFFGEFRDGELSFDIKTSAQRDKNQ